MALGKILLAVGIDLLFLALVVMVNVAMQHYVFDRVVVSGTAAFTFRVLDWAFTLSTLGGVISFLLHDLYVSLLRPWRNGGADS